MWKDLGNPKPRTEPGTYTPLQWTEGEALPLAGDSGAGKGEDGAMSLALTSFSALVASRRTRYSLGAIDLPGLGDLFSLTSRITLTGPDPLGFALTQRPAPSAGAIHPLHVVVQLPGCPGLFRYDPLAHALRALVCRVSAVELRDAMNRLVDGGDGALLLFVAEPAKTLAKYEDGCSLVWRDAGVLQGFFSMAAEALALNFILLGVTGEPWVSQLVEERGLVGVGAAFVGTRAQSGPRSP